LSTWNLYANRNITTYPQQFGTFGAGTDVQASLNQLFAARIPDPVQRQAAIDQFVQNRGLPSFLPGPVVLYTEQITLQESIGGSLGLLGARNGVFMNIFRVRNQPITGAGNPLPDVLGLNTNNTQYGAAISWSNNLTPQVALTTTADALRTVNNEQPGTTNQGSIRALLSSPLSALTTVYAGVRYQVFRSSLTVSENYDEAAVFVGLAHTFR